jgi:hypothetical protein
LFSGASLGLAAFATGDHSVAVGNLTRGNGAGSVAIGDMAAAASLELSPSRPVLRLQHRSGVEA